MTFFEWLIFHHSFQVSLFKNESETPVGEEETGVNYRELYQGNFLRNVLKQM